MQELGTSSTSGPEGTFALVSLVWLQGKGMFGGRAPGLLIAREGGRISLVTQKQKVFEAERHEIDVKWPWWGLGLSAYLKVAGNTYPFSWLPPTDPEGPSLSTKEREDSLDARWSRWSRLHRDQFYRQGSRQPQGVEKLPKYLEDGMIGSGEPQS